ncbi:nicotinate-nucleotide pyrophosphorylase [Thermoanaerobacterium thermosaccharolyticum]|uniref:nicotinate-nucleotide pyrophosphorylase n=1 Tax=Thermoanaerobacterium thermosaccharolyticum TaxID=1517 RepID=UPI003D2D7F1D
MCVELRDYLFLPLKNKNFYFSITSEENGMFAGADKVREMANELGLKVVYLAKDGTVINKGSTVFEAYGTASAVINAEEILLGLIGKPSGVATASLKFYNKADGRIKVVCGAWKKVLPEIRPLLRHSIALGGCSIRMCDEPFIYLDKNYIRLFGNIGDAVKRARGYDPTRLIVAQLRGENIPINKEAEEAYKAGAKILMIDTGNLMDLKLALDEAKNNNWRESVEFAFAGGIKIDMIDEIIDTGADIIDVGRSIIDAPMLDFKLDVKSVVE